MAKQNSLEPYRLLLYGMAAIALLTAGLVMGVSQKMGRNVLKPRLFSCNVQFDRELSQAFWTVFYQGVNPPQPWLRMIPGMEGDKMPEHQCERVALILDRHYPDQLQTLRHRPNPATPDRHAVCVETANQGETCLNLLILKPQTPPESFFERLTEDLQPSPPDDSQIDLRKWLATKKTP